MTLGQAFTWAIELEAGYQLSEGVSLARPPEIMQVQEIEEVDEIGAIQRRLRDVVCWECGEKGHLQRDCPHRTLSMQDNGFDDSNAYAGKSEQVIRITQRITVATRDNICHANDKSASVPVCYGRWVTSRTEITCLKDAIRSQRTHTEYRSPIGANDIGRNLASGCTKRFQPIRGSRGRQSGTFQRHHSKII